ncbi:ABC transporter permease [Bacteroides sp.]
MRQIFYAYQNIIRGWGEQIIKVVSLAVGLLVSILLFARVAFELNYDSFYPQPENLFLVQCAYTGSDGMKEKPNIYVYGKLPGALLENFPDQIESATVIRQDMGEVLYNGEKRFANRIGISADEHLFTTAGVRVLKGKAEALMRPDVIFLSESFAKEIFGDIDPVNKTLLVGKTEPVTVGGVFEDIPENSELRYDMVFSFANLLANNRGGWGYDVSYQGLVRFRNAGEAVDNVTARIPEMMKKYVTKRHDMSGEEYSFIPLNTVHSSMPDVHRMILIMSVLAIVLLLVTALNYVLISVSALPRRSKGVGVHKCSGASTGAVLRIFLWETSIIIGCALLLAAFLLFQFSELIEYAINVSLVGLFTWKTLWIPLIVILVLFVIAGILPGRLFASVPVTQVFRRYMEHKLSWKRPLLFVQFAGVSFIFGLLAVILMQYNMIMNSDLGYNPERVVSCYIRAKTEEKDNIKSILRSFPMVEDLAVSWNPMYGGYSGFIVYDLGGKVILDDARTSWCDFHFLPMMGVQLVQGRFQREPDEVVVNEELLERLHWTDSPLGKQIDLKWDNPKTIVGVIKNYTNRGAYSPKEPIIWIGSVEDTGGTFNVRLKEPFSENLNVFNEQMKEVFPTKDVVFVSLQENINKQYEPVRRFRNLVTIASLSILLITLMGLWGYTNDEVLRRSKEIAIRKVNGAEVVDILRLLSSSVFWIALPAVLLGVVASWFIGEKWMEQFPEYAVPGTALFVTIAILVLLLIIGCVILKAWRVANENPVNSIKSE